MPCRVQASELSRIHSMSHALTIVFRTDASSRIGYGHVMRCLTLAETLRQQGATARFVCREHEGHLCDLIEARGFLVSRLPKPALTGNDVSGDQAGHAEWLGVTWQHDADETLASLIALQIRPDWLIVDHYALDEQWERVLRPSVE